MSSINSCVRLSELNHSGPGCCFYEIYEWHIFQLNTHVYIINMDNVNFVTGMCMSMGPEYIWWQRATYSFMISFFILLRLMLSASKTPRYLYAPSSSSDLMVSSNGKLRPEDSTLWPRLIDKVPHF